MKFFLKISVMISFSFILNFNLHSQIIFQESFNSPNGTTSGTAFGVNWSSSCPTCLSGDYWEVRSNVFEARDTNGEAEWITDNSIDISNCDFIEISFNIQSVGTMEACGTGCNSADFVVFQYNIDGTGWTNPSNSSFCGGTCAGVNVVASDDVGSITYSTGCIPASGNGLRLRIAAQCWAASEYWRVDNITVVCSSPDAGTNGNLTICSSANPANLFSQLGGTPDNGGTWSGPSSLTGGSLGTFNPATMNPGTYTYTVGTAPCQASADVVVSVNNVNAGTNGAMSINCGPVTDDLLPYLGGNPDPGGVWTGPSPIPSNDPDGNFDPLTMLPGVYTYTVGTAPCQASSTVTVTILNNNNAGTNNTIALCNNSAILNLFDELGGTPNNGGTWNGPSVLTGGALGTFNPATMNAGVYTYTVGTAPCDVSATVTVTINPLGNAGTNSTITLCNNSAILNLFDELGGTPDNGGTWSGPSVLTGGALGTFNPATMNAGVYAYTVGTAPCDVSATVTVTINPLGNAGTNSAITLCNNSAILNLFDELGGTTDNGGTWTGPSTLTGGDLGTFNPATMNAGVYTYTVGTAPCDVSATVTVTINPLGNAGTNNAITLCNNSAILNLFDELGGTPNNGGTWSGPSTLTGGDLGTFNPATMNAGVYTYTVGTAPCDVSATVTVTINPLGNAGTNSTIDLCNNSAILNLFDELGGTPNNGGTWSGPSTLTGGDLGTFNPATMNAGVYTYTVGTAPCDVSATVTVTINPLGNPGTNNTIVLCNNSAILNLFNQLGGTPDNGGTWSGPSVLTGGDLGTFNPATMNAGVYTYTVGTTPCDVSATITVTINPLGNAGTNSTITLCNNSAILNLFDELGGTPDNGGTWNGPSALTGGALGTFNPATMNAGVYTYTVGTAPCDASATVTVTINPLGDAGTNNAITLCNNSAILNLFNQLGGTPDNGGTWTGPSTLTGGDLGTFNPATMNAGVYTYTVGTAPCDASATVTVTINPLGDAGTNNAITLCNNSAILNLFNELGGTPNNGGTWSGPSTLTGGDLGTFNPATMNAGVYTYTVGTAPCDASATVTVNLLGNLTLAIDSDTICVGETSTLIAVPSIPGGTFNWLPSGANSNTNSYAPVTSTIYTVTYSLGNNCSVTEAAEIIVNPLPNVSAGVDQTICEGDEIVLNGNGAQSYVWNNNIVNGVPFVPNTIGAQSYTVIGTDANGCSSTDIVTVTVLQVPIANGNPSTIIGEAPLTVTVDNLSSGGTLNEWYFGNGDNYTTSTNESVTTVYTNEGTYFIELVVSNGVCQSIWSQVITVISSTPEPIITIPNVFSPNNDGVNDVYKISMENVKSINATIVNRWGNVIAQYNDLNFSWDGRDANEGTYFIIYEIHGLDGSIKSGQDFFELVR